MAFLALLIGVVLVVAAIRGTHGELFSAIGKDIPGFVIWGAAIFAVAAIGFIPGLKPVSRGLLALLFVVLILTNYEQVLGGFQNAWQGAKGQASGQATAPTGGSNWLSSLGNLTGFDFSSLTATDTSGASGSVSG